MHHSSVKIHSVLFASHSFLIHTSHEVNSAVFKHFKTDDFAERTLVLKKLKEGVHIK